MTYILGVDPGASGGWAVLDGSESICQYGRMDKLDARDHADQIADLAIKYPGLFAIVERAQAFPGQGVVACFKYGVGYGFWQGVLMAHGIGFETVQPLTWQRSLGVANSTKASKIDHKRALMAHARQRWPALPKHSGVCDAVLIGLWGLRTRNGGRDA